ncbi:MAG TPA: DNA-binding protein [Verrucomicrobiae bacterium]|nr:DNA-binding protein [Verrucomicrobiae bacterium]
MKQVITKEDVSSAMNDLNAQGKKPTLVAIHAVLNHRGSMSTLVRLKGEIDAEAQRPTDSAEALEAFREVWDLARNEERKEQEGAASDLRQSLQALAAENERLEGTATAAQKRAKELEEAKLTAEADLQLLSTSAERDLSRATSTIRDAGLQAAKALQDLADARGAHATQMAALQSDLTTAQRTAHEFELQLVRANALLEAKGLPIETLPAPAH